MTRQSPSISATECEVGTRKKGNDGKQWIVVKVKGGVHRWQKYTPFLDDCINFPKYKRFAEKHKRLTLAHLKKVKPGTKLKLIYFLFGFDKAERFTFEFDHIEPVKGRDKKWYSHNIHGKSELLGELPLPVLTNGEIRTCISSDASEVYLA